MSFYSIISCPTHLGLWPSGVQELGRRLLDHGLAERLSAKMAGEVLPGPYIREKDPTTKYLNGPAIVAQSLALADLVTRVRAEGRVPMILGGDCSIVLGALVSLRRSSRPGLFYLDGHQDFYDGSGDHSGEVADMGLGIAVGHMHPLLANIEGLSPYVDPQHAVAFGYRDTEEIVQKSGRTFEGVNVVDIGLHRLHRIGLDAGIKEALTVLTAKGSGPFWLHFDTDVVDDSLNPAVDYNLPGGLDWNEVVEVLRGARNSGRMAGISVSIFNPRKDHDGRIAMAITNSLVAGLRD